MHLARDIQPPLPAEQPAEPQYHCGPDDWRLPAVAYALLASLVCTSSTTAHPSMPKQDTLASTVTNELATLKAGFRYDTDSGKLHVMYSVRNNTDQPLMIMDGGTAKEGVVAPNPKPTRKTQGDGMTFSFKVLGLPNPAPTVPRTTLAHRLESGQSHASAFTVALLAVGIHSVRFCIAVAPADEAMFRPLDGHQDLWRASFRLADAQTLLCTPRFDLQTSQFAEHGPDLP